MAYNEKCGGDRSQTRNIPDSTTAHSFTTVKRTSNNLSKRIQWEKWKEEAIINRLLASVVTFLHIWRKDSLDAMIQHRLETNYASISGALEISLLSGLQAKDYRVKDENRKREG